MTPDSPKPYLNPYIAGILLGLLLLVTFFITGGGFGASGAFAKIAAQLVHLVAPSFAEGHQYLAHYYHASPAGPSHSTWLLVLAPGVILGGFLSGIASGRFGAMVERGPRISSGGRLAWAFAGGILIGVAARLARGCTSGQGLVGGSLLSVGSWLFLFSIFAGGYAAAYFFRKQWN